MVEDIDLFQFFLLLMQILGLYLDYHDLCYVFYAHAI
jgi:hypothetical protein